MHAWNSAKSTTLQHCFKKAVFSVVEEESADENTTETWNSDKTRVKRILSSVTLATRTLCLKQTPMSKCACCACNTEACYGAASGYRAELGFFRSSRCVSQSSSLKTICNNVAYLYCTFLHLHYFFARTFHYIHRFNKWFLTAYTHACLV